MGRSLLAHTVNLFFESCFQSVEVCSEFGNFLRISSFITRSQVPARPGAKQILELGPGTAEEQGILSS